MNTLFFSFIFSITFSTPFPSSGRARGRKIRTYLSHPRYVTSIYHAGGTITADDLNALAADDFPGPLPRFTALYFETELGDPDHVNHGDTCAGSSRTSQATRTGAGGIYGGFTEHRAAAAAGMTEVKRPEFVDQAELEVYAAAVERLVDSKMEGDGEALGKLEPVTFPHSRSSHKANKVCGM